MKKLLACMALAMSMTVCATAFADAGIDYNYDSNNSVTNITEGYKTVLITKSNEELTSESIVYVDQAESGFDATTDFLLKENPEPGYYSVIYGSDNPEVSSKKYSFVIGDGVNIQASDEMSFITEEDESDYTYTDKNGVKTYKRAYQLATTADRFDSYNSVKLVYNENTEDGEPFTSVGAYPKELLFENVGVLSGECDVYLFVQFHGMSKEQYDEADKWNVFFSVDSAVAEVVE